MNLVRSVVTRRILRAWALGKEVLGSDVFSAPNLEILFALHAAEAEGASPTGAELARSLDMTEDVALRWLEILLRRGLVDVENAAELGPQASLRIGARCEAALDEVMKLAEL